MRQLKKFINDCYFNDKMKRNSESIAEKTKTDETNTVVLHNLESLYDVQRKFESQPDRLGQDKEYYRRYQSCCGLTEAYKITCGLTHL